eukprot:TRINITY_DN9644_c0_g1_i1.p2 TRINITY_DN9644_c0_g1~~TRINITY_DN9644_c0_g1_i1.p2  ORF type:complete len:179 (-),score=45.81 TRINITY_DN9644_c0_g1_i1:4-540(-)
MGVSFGAPRHLRFQHPGTLATFDFPQNNGDIFAFTSVANQRFQHGVPKANPKVGPRFSIIAWGSRRTLNERNSGKEEQEKSKKEECGERDTMRSSSGIHSSQEIPKTEEKKEIVLQVDDVVQLVTDWISQQEEKKKKPTSSPTRGGATRGRSRVQGGWSGGGAKGSPTSARGGRGRGK